jgi:hypothetical protein
VSVRVELCETAATPDGTHIRKQCGFVLALRMLRTSILGCVCIFPAYMQIRENHIAKQPYFGGRILSSILACGVAMREVAAPSFCQSRPLHNIHRSK